MGAIPVALIFPGQGAQEVGMGIDFYEQSPHAKSVFDQADKIIPGLKDVVFRGPQEKLTTTAFCQPGIFTFSIAALEAFRYHPKFKLVEPRFACGLSLGEYSALTATGMLSFEDTLRLVERRSSFMDEATKVAHGKMAAVLGFEKEKLLEVCRETGAEVANFNSPDQIVITGNASMVESACELIKARGAKRVIPLDVAGAFHSSLMKTAEEKFAVELTRVKFNAPQFPIVSNVNGQPSVDVVTTRTNLARQITSSVQWVDTILNISKAGIKLLFEIGPGTVLKGLIRKIDPQLQVVSIQKPKDFDNLPL